MNGYTCPSTIVPSRAGIRGETCIPDILRRRNAGDHDAATLQRPDPVTVPWYRAGLRGEWWKRAVGRGK